MKKLLLILTLPFLIDASEKKDDLTTTQKVVHKATGWTFFTASLYNIGKGAWDLTEAIEEGNYISAIGIAAGSVLQAKKIEMAANVIVDAVDPSQQPDPSLTFKLAKEELDARNIVEEELACQTLRRCLNEHARCSDLNARGIPKRCGSPARRYAMLNETAADRMIAIFKKHSNE